MQIPAVSEVDPWYSLGIRPSAALPTRNAHSPSARSADLACGMFRSVLVAKLVVAPILESLPGSLGPSVPAPVLTPGPSVALQGTGALVDCCTLEQGQRRPVQLKIWG